MSKMKTFFTKKLQGFKSKLGKRSQLLLAGILAVIMLIIFFKGVGSSGASKESSPNTETAIITSSDYAEVLEVRLENIISAIKGIGAVEAFIMTETSVETIYATSEETKGSGESSSLSSEIVFSKDGSTTTPIKKLEIYPEITGVLIVAEGVNDEKLRLMVINAVAVALDLENSKIEVLSGEKA